MMATFSDIAKGRIRAKASCGEHIAGIVIDGKTVSHDVVRIHLMASIENAEGFRLAAAAINGELGSLLEELFEFCDDLGDGAPDSPPYAHRALNLATRLDAALPKPAKAEGPKVTEPAE